MPAHQRLIYELLKNRQAFLSSDGASSLKAFEDLYQKLFGKKWSQDGE